MREIPIVQTVGFVEARASAKTAKDLSIDVGDEVFRINNLLILGGEPVLFDEIEIARAMFPTLDEDTFATRDSTVYGFYQSAFGVSVIRTFDKLGAVAADVSPQRGWACRSACLCLKYAALPTHSKTSRWRAGAA